MAKYIVLFVYGVALSVAGFGFTDWQYWVLLILTAGYGLAIGCECSD